MWTGAVISPGTYFLTHPAQIRCCTPFANIRTRKNPWIADRYGKSGVNSTKIKNAEKINSNARNIQKGILNRYHFLWNPVESSSIEWASWVTRLIIKNCSINSIVRIPSGFLHFITFQFWNVAQNKGILTLIFKTTGGDDVPKLEPIRGLHYSRVDKIVRDLRRIYKENPTLFDIPTFAQKQY